MQGHRCWGRATFLPAQPVMACARCCVTKVLLVCYLAWYVYAVLFTGHMKVVQSLTAAPSAVALCSLWSVMRCPGAFARRLQETCFVHLTVTVLLRPTAVPVYAAACCGGHSSTANPTPTGSQALCIMQHMLIISSVTCQCIGTMHCDGKDCLADCEPGPAT